MVKRMKRSALLFLASSLLAQQETDRYYFALLYRGPSASAARTPEEAQRLQAGHMAHIDHMSQLGKLVAAGPMAEAGEVRGVFLFKADSLADVKALAEQDPSIQAGRLRLEWMTWTAKRHIGQSLGERYRKDPKTPMTMARHSLVLLRGPADAELPRQLMDQAHLAAGPVSGHSSIRAILVSSEADSAKVKAASAAPGFTVEVLPWFVAREVWP